MKRFINWLTVASLLFLAYYLYQSDTLQWPHIYRYGWLMVSLLALFAGFIAQVFTWKAVVAQAGLAVDTGVCLSGTGMTVFAKYIPGKVMVIVGRAAYVAQKYGYRLETLSALSLTTQLITLWVGLTLGAVGLLLLDKPSTWQGLTIGLWLALTVSVFSPYVNVLLGKILRLFLKREVEVTVAQSSGSGAIITHLFVELALVGVRFLCLNGRAHYTRSTIDCRSGLSVSHHVGYCSYAYPRRYWRARGLVGGLFEIARL